MNGDLEVKVLNMLRDIVMMDVNLNDELIDSGILDSISAVDLALKIEELFSVSVSANDIPIHFKNALLITDYIKRKVGND